MSKGLIASLCLVTIALGVTDESRRFPKTGLIRTEVVDRQFMGKSFLPSGTVGHYKQGKTEYSLFVAKLASPTAAAIALSDWRKTMNGPKLIPSFGGYFGEDGGKPVFVFAKGPWIAGVKGLVQKEADLRARTLASMLPTQ
ncbi:MAG: hypothetical protein H7039_16705 [Bryobacteraceae bacterium]|nr:hypothetical protein [Bryobacteraceae bacterium]